MYIERAFIIVAALDLGLMAAAVVLFALGGTALSIAALVVAMLVLLIIAGMVSSSIRAINDDIKTSQSGPTIIE